jgi:hypothetical protein
MTKDVTISVSNRTIKVQILLPSPPPGYNPLDSTVTATPHLPFVGDPIAGGAVFLANSVPNGTFDVNVKCSDATFGQTVTVPSTFSATFHHSV